MGCCELMKNGIPSISHCLLGVENENDSVKLLDFGVQQLIQELSILGRTSLIVLERAVGTMRRQINKTRMLCLSHGAIFTIFSSMVWRVWTNCEKPLLLATVD